MRNRSAAVSTLGRASLLVNLVVALVVGVVVAAAVIGCSKREAEEEHAVPPAPKVPPAAPALSMQDIASGLKEALANGTEKAIANLSKQDGFLKNPEVKIPLPPTLAEIDKGLRLVGKEQYADEFVVSMNHAAEAAVAEVGPIFANAIRDMTLTEAKQILQGSDAAATQYFRHASQARLEQNMLPIVKQATDTVGATAAYKSLMNKASFLGTFMHPPEVDLDRYVADNALDGLFKMIAAEEKEIRADPMARTSVLLKTDFSAAAK